MAEGNCISVLCFVWNLSEELNSFPLENCFLDRSSFCWRIVSSVRVCFSVVCQGLSTICFWAQGQDAPWVSVKCLVCCCSSLQCVLLQVLQNQNTDDQLLQELFSAKLLLGILCWEHWVCYQDGELFLTMLKLFGRCQPVYSRELKNNNRTGSTCPLRAGVWGTTCSVDAWVFI